MSVCVHLWVPALAFIHVCICVPMHECVYACVHIYTCLCLCMCVHKCASACECVCVRACVCACVVPVYHKYLNYLTTIDIMVFIFIRIGVLPAHLAVHHMSVHRDQKRASDHLGLKL